MQPAVGLDTGHSRPAVALCRATHPKPAIRCERSRRDVPQRTRNRGRVQTRLSAFLSRAHLRARILARLAVEPPMIAPAELTSSGGRRWA